MVMVMSLMACAPLLQYTRSEDALFGALHIPPISSTIATRAISGPNGHFAVAAAAAYGVAALPVTLCCNNQSECSGL